MRVLLILLGMLWMKGENPSELIITKQKITVSGQTSFGAFDCDYTQVGLKDTLVLNARGIQKAMRFQIPVRDFSCGNFLLNKDFRSTIKAEKYPVCEVQVGNFKTQNGEILCDMTVLLVGKKLEFPNLKLHQSQHGLFTELRLSFDRLELQPPNKLGGLVKVEENLDLEVLLGF